MRIAVVTESRDRVGGVEAYLEEVIPGLARAHELAFWSATANVTIRGAISLPTNVADLSRDESGRDPVAELCRWRPDLIFAHGLQDTRLESNILRIAPAVIVQHTYHGTCISGTKTKSWPRSQACTRPFGAACVALYVPRRCGGLNPLTMLQLYGIQSTRLSALRSAVAVVTLSAHMAEEVRRNGVRPERVHVVAPFVGVDSGLRRARERQDASCSLLFMGRIEPLKGLDRLLAAITIAVKRLPGRLRLVVAGEGAARSSLEQVATVLCAREPRIEVVFVGWQDGAAKADLLETADALVVPSVWPEPFGLVGLEAAAHGVPSVAFAAGGIPEWLTDGQNGCLAPARGARPEALADAIVRCVAEPEVLARLRAGARHAAATWTLERHLARLQDVFDGAVRSCEAGSSETCPHLVRS